MTKKRRRPLSPSEKKRQKEFSPSLSPRVQEQSIVFNEGKLEKKDEFYCHIYHRNRRVGRGYIVELDGKPMITVELNQSFQGIGIGRIAFRQICELSQYHYVYAKVRKNNISSIKALKLAGFQQSKKSHNGQYLFEWRRDHAKY